MKSPKSHLSPLIFPDLLQFVWEIVCSTGAMEVPATYPSHSPLSLTNPPTWLTWTYESCQYCHREKSVQSAY